MNSLALLIPCYNEEKRLKVDEIKNFIEGQPLIDFYFINDGSNDDTERIINQYFLGYPNCFLLTFQENRGKGKVIRKAVLSIKDKDYSLFGFIDADFEIPFSQIPKLLEKMKSKDVILAISSRNLYGSMKLNNTRSLLSIVMMKMANRIIGFDKALADTQCGNKIFKKEIIEVCFTEDFISEWLFDIEIFLRLKKADPGFRQNIIEVPLDNLKMSSGASRFTIWKNLKILKQLRLIHISYNR